MPHFNDPELDTVAGDLGSHDDPAPAPAPGTGQCALDTGSVQPDSVKLESAPEPAPRTRLRIEGESEDDYLVRTCRYCGDNNCLELEHLLHCDGIWLHALRYSGRASTYIGTDKNRNTDGNTNTDKDNDKDEDKDKDSKDSKDFEWDFSTPYPDWAKHFLANQSHTQTHTHT